jgi:ankyrin repeat protein
MIQPNELKLALPMYLPGDIISTTTKVWNILAASYKGDLATVKKMVEECPALIYAQYNYTPPVHFAVREGHIDLVKYLLSNGAHDTSYKNYPFLDNLVTIAEDRGLTEIVSLLAEYANNNDQQFYKGDNGKIDFQRTGLQKEFEDAVDKEDLEITGQLLKVHPEFALDETYFWGEGILTFAVKQNNRAMIDLLVSYGAKVPDILKWTQAYYFEHDKGAEYIMQKGMNPNTRSWQEVTILHNMAQKGKIPKAELLLKYGADINPVDDDYQSTPLGMAARWGQAEMVEFLLSKGADPNKSGASWSTPLAWARKKGHGEIERILMKWKK